MCNAIKSNTLFYQRSPFQKEVSVSTMAQKNKQTDRRTLRIVDMPHVPCHLSVTATATATDPHPANSLTINSRLVAKLISRVFNIWWPWIRPCLPLICGLFVKASQSHIWES